MLNDVERECIVTHGYGLHSFAHALVDNFRAPQPSAGHPESHAQVSSFATDRRSAIEFLPEVPETLQYLSHAHRLILVTKGAVPSRGEKSSAQG